MSVYSCGRCGRAVSKDTQVCPSCGAHLAGIKCTHCGFIGSRDDFPLDVCPRCHRRIRPQTTSPSPLTLSPGCRTAIGKIFRIWLRLNLAVLAAIAVLVVAYLIVSGIQAVF
jgi:RNA polymerase subunit RPABC4/transcription elongation factor Spt4